MKKMLIIIFTIFIIGTGFIYINRHKVSEYIVNVIAIQLDKEQPHKVGKDTVLIWENGVFQIGHYASGNHLEFHENALITALLKNVNTYKKKDNELYVVAQEGYAVIDEKNIAKVLVTVPEDEYISGYNIGENSENILHSRRINKINITYITSFDEFSEKEQKMLNKIIS